MSFADKAKALNIQDVLGEAKEQAEKIATDHGDQVEDAIDKAADFIASKAPGGVGDKVQAAADKAKDMVEDLADKPAKRAKPAKS